MNLKIENIASNLFISSYDKEIIIADKKHIIIGKLNLLNDNANTINKVAQLLKKYNIQISNLNRYDESKCLNAFIPLRDASLRDGVILKLKQPPPEAFLFGFSAVLMTAGPKTYFIFGDERKNDCYYPEMDWPVGKPLGEMRQVADKVFRRDFEYLSAFINLSEKEYLLPDSKDFTSFSRCCYESF